jgi:hypothetical protein
MLNDEKRLVEESRVRILLAQAAQLTQRFWCMFAKQEITRARHENEMTVPVSTFLKIEGGHFRSQLKLDGSFGSSRIHWQLLDIGKG